MSKAAKCDICKKLYEPYDDNKIIKANERDMIFVDVLSNKESSIEKKKYYRQSIDVCLLCRTEIITKIIQLSK